MTALQSIIKEAKSLKAKYPKRYNKWTDYVKQASAIYSSKHKGKSPVGKKRKVGAAKPLSKHKDTKSHNVNIRVVSGIKKKKAVKKSVKKSTTLTKVKQVLKKDHKRLKHGYNLLEGNVRIGAINNERVKHYQDIIKKIELNEKSLYWIEKAVKDKKNSLIVRNFHKKHATELKKYLKELKTQKAELKKLI
jgi:hypothetical protein